MDVHVLNHDGNLVDSCSIAAIAAMAHFRSVIYLFNDKMGGIPRSNSPKNQGPSNKRDLDFGGLF